MPLGMRKIRMDGCYYVITVLHASTITELEEKYKEWEREVNSSGLEDIYLGFSLDRVEKTPYDYQIKAWSHV